MLITTLLIRKKRVTNHSGKTLSTPENQRLISLPSKGAPSPSLFPIHRKNPYFCAPAYF